MNPECKYCKSENTIVIAEWNAEPEAYLYVCRDCGKVTEQ